VLAAVLVSSAAFFATAIYTLITAGYGCQGSDAAEPPPEGSIGDLLCPAPAWVSHLALGGVAIIAPLLAVSPWPRWLDLRIGLAISAGSIFVMGLIGSVIVSGGDILVYPPLAVFAAAVVLATRPRQGRGGGAP
jgi:hypothetical protein